MSDFWAMGGYGGFVWPAFVVTAVVLIGLLIASLQRLRGTERELARLQAATGRDRKDNAGRSRKNDPRRSRKDNTGPKVAS